jgi:hypothetical protein
MDLIHLLHGVEHPHPHGKCDLTWMIFCEIIFFKLAQGIIFNIKHGGALCRTQLKKPKLDKPKFRK